MTSHPFFNFICGCVFTLFLVALFPQNQKNQQTESSEIPRAESLKITGEIRTRSSSSDRSAILTREDNGHYWTYAEIDGVPIKFLADTGASVVALTWRDASLLRLKPETRDFKWLIRTANGETLGASVMIDHIRIGKVEIENVEAMIMQEGLMDTSLLGISFLEKLDSYEFNGERMLIRQ